MSFSLLKPSIFMFFFFFSLALVTFLFPPTRVALTGFFLPPLCSKRSRISHREWLTYNKITLELLFQDVNICFLVLSCDKLSSTTSVTTDGTERHQIKPNRCSILFQKPNVTNNL